MILLKKQKLWIVAALWLARPMLGLAGDAPSSTPNQPSGDSDATETESVFVPASASTEPEWWDKLKASSFNGHLRQETAYRLNEPRVFTKIRQQALLTESGAITDSLKFRATQRGYYDAVYAATDNFPKTARHSQQFDVEIRETYLDYSHGPVDVRVGKQQVVWGESVGLFFADVVNAKDLREYILPEFDLIRIPQWGMDLELAQDPLHGELVWLLPEYHRLAVSGAEFEQPYPVPDTATFTFTDPSKPPKTFSNSEVGTRWSYLLGDWDLGAFYLYTWDKFPVLYRSIVGNVYRFSPEYRRAHLLGLTSSKEIRDVVLKGELVFNPAAYFATFDPQDADGVVRRAAFDYVLGADYTFFGRLSTNVQLMQRAIVNHNELLANEEALRTHVSFRAKTDVLNGKIEPAFLIIAGLNQPDLLYRPSVDFHLTDSLQLRLGADVFQGKPSGLFGRFDTKSRLYTELTLYF